MPYEEHGGTRAGGREEEQDVLDLSSNINPYGPLPNVLAAARETPLDTYPDPVATAARQALAARWAVPIERLALSPGAAAGIHRCINAFVSVGDSVVIAGPTFGEYRRATAAAGGVVVEPSAAVGSPALGVDALVGAIALRKPALVFVCSPNNPTGRAVTDAELDAVLTVLPSGALLVLDESYRSFAEGHLATPHRPEDPRIVHIRSFTKDLALPGLRVAALCADPRVVDALQRSAPPWAVSAPAQAALRAALEPESLEALNRQLARVQTRREQLSRALQSAGWRPLPNQRASFVTSWAPDAKHTATTLESDWGIRVRYCASFGLPEHIRVGVPAEDSAAEDPIDRLRTAIELIHSSPRTHSEPI